VIFSEILLAVNQTNFTVCDQGGAYEITQATTDSNAFLWISGCSGDGAIRRFNYGFSFHQQFSLSRRDLLYRDGNGLALRFRVQSGRFHQSWLHPSL
jgi:hypothetical protein